MRFLTTGSQSEPYTGKQKQKH